MAFIQCTLIFAVALGALHLVRGQTSHTVMVGLQGSFFDPPTISAGLNDTVTFVFAGFVHTVTQSSLANPCTPLPGGFSSGPAGKLTNASQPAQTWDLLITNVSQPIWFFCEVTQPTSHCTTSGMVGVINPPSIAVYTQWRASAQMVTSTPLPNFQASLTGIGAFATNTPTIPTTFVSIPPISSNSSSTLQTQTSTSSDAFATSSAPTGGASRSSSTSHLGAIVGGAVGGAVVLVLVVAGIIWSCRARQQRSPLVSPSADDANFFRYNPLPVRRPSEAFVEAKQLEIASLATPPSHNTPPRALSPDTVISPNRRGAPVFPPGVPRVVEPLPAPPSSTIERQTSFGSNMSSSHSPISSEHPQNINMHALANEVAGLLRAPSFKTAVPPNQNPSAEGGRTNRKYADPLRSGFDRTDTPLGPPAYRTAMANSPDSRPST